MSLSEKEHQTNCLRLFPVLLLTPPTSIAPAEVGFDDDDEPNKSSSSSSSNKSELGLLAFDVTFAAGVAGGGDVDSCPLSPNKSTSGDSSDFPNKMSSSPNNPVPEDFFWKFSLDSKSKLSTTDEVKDKLLQLLLTQSQGLLVNSGCPIEKTLLSSISKGETYNNLSPEVRRALINGTNNKLTSKVRKCQNRKKCHDQPMIYLLIGPLVRNSHTPPSDLSTNRQHIPSSAPSLTPPLMPHGKTRDENII
ncbi:hypothetical protein KUTeg_000701 [Tegillarca granosa]|uniref:Uncharacterized protein n=1 Tax=Tegillarca granosa TaxID=220873 RepID=A0ABQ9G2L5_TEGGR|nr:hypothetical protein KUTeg_000701 [Tegillarca granosa]